MEIIVPKLYEDMENGFLCKWFKKENDAVEEGEVIFSLETDKAVFEIESETRGIIKKILVGENNEVKATQVVGYLETTD